MHRMSQGFGGKTTKISLTALAFAVLVLAAGTATVSATDWSQKAHDVENTGHSPDTLAPTDSIDEDWIFNVTVDHVDGGVKETNRKIGFSSATIVNGTAYFGDTGSRNNHVYAVNTMTGELIWRYHTGGWGGSDVRTTPAVANGRVYVGDSDGTLHIIDTETGTEEFKIELGTGTASDKVNQPTVEDGNVYFGTDQSKLHAYDATSGVVRWVFDMDSNTIPKAPAVGDDAVYATTSGLHEQYLYKIDTATGQEVWNVTVSDAGTSKETLQAPTLLHGNVYVADQVYSEGKLTAYDTETGDELWNFSTGAENWAAPAVAGCSVYVGNSNGDLYSVDAADGTEKWDATLPGRVRSAPTVANGHVYIGDDSGQLHAMNASNGVREWAKRLDGRILSSPTPHDGNLYVGGKNNLYRFSGNTPDLRNTDSHGTEPCATDDSDDDVTFDLGVELQQTANVTQGDDINITTWVNNPASQDVTNVTTELLIDTDGDGSYASDEVVTQTVEDYGGGDYTPVNLTYADVQIQPGEYDYASRVRKNGNTTWSFTNGKLNVTSSDSSGDLDFGIELPTQSATVSQGGDVDITASPRNNAEQPVSDATLELVVDQNQDGQFGSGEVVDSKTVAFDAGEKRQEVLTYSNVRLSSGTYSYQTQIRKNAQKVTSFTTGTLNVTSGGDFQEINIQAPGSVSPGGALNVDYTVQGGNSHQVEVDPSGDVEANITSYNGSSLMSNIGDANTSSQNNPDGVARLDAFETDASFGITSEVIGGTDGDTLTITVTVLQDDSIVDNETEVVSVSQSHPSGVSQALFDEIAGQNGNPGEVDRSDVVDMIDAFFGPEEIAGGSLDRSDVVDIINWFFQN